MAENQTLNQMINDEASKEINFNFKSETQEGKLILMENPNFNSHSMQAGTNVQERLKEGKTKLTQTLSVAVTRFSHRHHSNTSTPTLDIQRRLMNHMERSITSTTYSIIRTTY